jgi:hypothetical protein
MIDDPGLALDIASIASSRSLPDAPPAPRPPKLTEMRSAEEQMEAVQRFVESFEYNYSGKPFFKLVKSKGTKHIHASASSLIEAALPIQCVEAVFISLYLTSPLKNLIRIPVSFKSRHKGNSHKHIVLAVYDKMSHRWGALGLSRRASLMYKPLIYNSFVELIREFEKSYEQCFHKLTKVYLSEPIAHDLNKVDKSVRWKVETIRMVKSEPRDDPKYIPFERRIANYLEALGLSS